MGGIRTLPANTSHSVPIARIAGPTKSWFQIIEISELSETILKGLRLTQGQIVKKTNS